MCDFIEKLAGDAKGIYDGIEMAVGRLEKAFDDKLALQVVAAVGNLENFVKAWEEDEKALLAADMGRYRIDWADDLRGRLPDRANEVATRLANRKSGIDRSNALQAKIAKLTEYATRGQAKLKTVERLKAAYYQEKKGFAKLLEEATELGKSLAK